ncbi:hypothetical protein [Methylobacterium bullatum]|uniref:hypothetical protein n=1 Tax=Methylobacterium bullatum TaxID=570505 RepID=UPI001EE23421|nr:hypothetical protein [Methylobacterium bullatum]
MQPDASVEDKAARIIAANVYYAFRGQGTTLIDPSHEGTLLARLVEAIRPEIGGSAEAMITAINTVLLEWEEGSEEAPSPRVRSINLADGSVSMERTTGDELTHSPQGRDDV